MKSDIESRRFQVPSEIVKELEAGGYVRSATDLLVKGGVDVGALVLTVYNTGAPCSRCLASSVPWPSHLSIGTVVSRGHTHLS